MNKRRRQKYQQARAAERESLAVEREREEALRLALTVERERILRELAVLDIARSASEREVCRLRRTAIDFALSFRRKIYENDGYTSRKRSYDPLGCRYGSRGPIRGKVVDRPKTGSKAVPADFRVNPLSPSLPGRATVSDAPQFGKSWPTQASLSVEPTVCVRYPVKELRPNIGDLNRAIDAHLAKLHSEGKKSLLFED